MTKIWFLVESKDKIVRRLDFILHFVMFAFVCIVDPILRLRRSLFDQIGFPITILCYIGSLAIIDYCGRKLNCYLVTRYRLYKRGD